MPFRTQEKQSNQLSLPLRDDCKVSKGFDQESMQSSTAPDPGYQKIHKGATKNTE